MTLSAFRLNMLGPFCRSPSLKWQLQSLELLFGTAPSARLHEHKDINSWPTRNCKTY